MEERTEQTINITHIDFKDVPKLEAYINAHSRIMNRNRTGFSAKEQRDFAKAVKRARFMALVPYVSH